MSTLLARLGSHSFRHPARVLAVWLLILMAVIALVLSTDGRIRSSVTVDGTPAQEQLDRIRAELPDAGGAQGSIVFRADDDDTPLDAAELGTVAAAVRAAEGLDFVVDKAARTAQRQAELQARAQSPQQLQTMTAMFGELQRGTDPQGRPLVLDGTPVPGVTLSVDGTIAVYDVQLSDALDDLPPGVADELMEAVDGQLAGTALQAYPSDSLLPLEPPVGGHELVGLAVAAVVLLLTLGSLVAAGLPLLTAVTGVAIGVGGAFGLSGFYTMTSTTPVLALMLGLAVGIDYALFILHRQRSLILHEGMSAHDATRRAVGTSGTAVVFAGLTVIVALLGLLVLRISFVSTMALATAATIAIAVSLSVTALPALLGLVGERVVGKRARARAAAGGKAEEHRVGRGWARALTARPLVVIVGVVLALGLLALPVADMRLGMPGGGAASESSPERINHDLTARALGEGANGPLLVAVEKPAGEPDLAGVRATLDTLGGFEGVASAALRGTSEHLEIYALTPVTGPLAPETTDLVHDLRDAGYGVTGLTAINIDLSQKLADAVPLYLSIIAGLSLLILLLVFRSVVIPVAATLGFLLTIGATFGVTTLVFGTVLSFLPIMATGILYGLAMDYQLFLGTAMREAYVHGATPREAVVEGFAHASRVVVAAAVIMISVFGVFVLTDDITIRQFGLTLAVGILIDALLIRMVLIPVVMSRAGRAAWWLPRWLDRALPRLDVEGSALRN